MSSCFILVELIGDRLDRKVLIGHPGLLFRVHVPKLLHASGKLGRVSFRIFEEDSSVSCGAVHGVKALLAELSYVEPLVVGLADLIGSFTRHVVGNLALFF